MAIIKTTFTGATRADQYEELLAWLQTATVGYFTSVEGNDSNHKIFVDKIDDYSGLLTFYPNSDSYMMQVHINNTTFVPMYSLGSNFKYVYGVTTSKGFFLQWGPDETSTICGCIFVSKTTTGDVFLVIRFYDGSSGNGRAGCINLSATTSATNKFDWVWDGYGPDSLQGTSTSTLASYTALTPISSSITDVICTNILQVHFNQFRPSNEQYLIKPGILTINNATYFTDGYLALADT